MHTRITEFGTGMRESLVMMALAAAFVFALAPFAAHAADATLQVKESQAFGQYLTDGSGQPLYLFTADTQGKGQDMAEISCSDACLDAWPLFYAEAKPTADSGVDDSLIGTIDHDGRMVVTYNGWPLYYFARDAGADAPQGQDVQSFGGEWYLVTPDGQKVEAH